MVDNSHRKLAAVMFTDMVGYSAMVQKNETLALELLDEHRMIVRSILPEFGGKEIETPGDAFFVRFDSALQAVHCAIAVQKAFFERNKDVHDGHRIMLRAGVHLGDVVEKGKSVMGDCVNIAARIEPLARPGCVCVSQDVARQIANKIEYPLIKMSTHKLKNIDLPVELFTVQLPWIPEEPPTKIKMIKTMAGKKPADKSAWAFRIIFLVIIGLLAISLLFRDEPDRGNAIAVLPFRNMSGNAEDEYFSDGMTEDVIAQLAKLSGLKVISRTSVMQYKTESRNLKEIGSELDVGIILEGSVRRSGDQVRIVAQLIDAESDDHLWVETYDEKLTEIFAIQTAVAEKIARSLNARISNEERLRLNSEATKNMAAYDLYLKGRYHWNKRMPDELNKGIGYFNQALELDPTYALAYCGLADSYIILGNYYLSPPHESFQDAKQAALKALEIDPELAEAHTSLAYALCYSDWDWKNAEKEFKKALALNQNLAQAFDWYALYLTITGRFDEAGNMRQQALMLDPLSVVINADVGLALYMERKYEPAIAQNLKTLAMDPGLGALAHIPLGGSYLRTGKTQEGLKSFSEMNAKMISIAPTGHNITIAAIGYGYAWAGRTEQAYDMLELLMEKGGDEYVSPFWVAVLYIGLKEYDQALQWLDRAFEEKDGSLVYIKVMPVFDPVRTDRRFISLLEKTGLSAY